MLALRRAKHANFCSIPSGHYVKAKSSARNMIDCYGLFSGQNRVNGWYMRCRKDADLARHRGKSGRPRVRLKTSMVEVDFTAKPPPARHWNNGVEPRSFGSL